MIWLLIIGLAAGWLFGSVMKDDELEFAGGLIAGSAGALIGGNVYSISGLTGDGAIVELSMAVGGAVLLLLLLRLIMRLPLRNRLDGMPGEDTDTESRTLE